MKPELSVIIPVLNDSEALQNLAQSLSTQKKIKFEVIVVDGGKPKANESTASKRICSKNELRYFHSEPGRGKQMNLGRVHARSDYLLFLHADSELSKNHQLRDALDVIKSKEKDTPFIAGHFGLSFQTNIPQLGFMLGFLEKKSQLNRKNSTNGDQGLMISSTFFDEIEGFSEQLPFLEDQIIAAKIQEKGQMFTLPHLLLTSARRFEEEGFVRRYYLMMIIMGAYHTQTEELFELAPTLYINQDEAGKLDMRPFFETFAQLHQTLGWVRSVRLWREVGMFARENLWQIFLFLDFVLEVIEADETQFDPTFLKFYDKRISPLEHPSLDNLLGLGAYLTVTKSAPMVYESMRLFRRFGLSV